LAPALADPRRLRPDRLGGLAVHQVKGRYTCKKGVNIGETQLCR
jgi:hypothetical protein